MLPRCGRSLTAAWEVAGHPRALAPACPIWDTGLDRSIDRSSRWMIVAAVTILSINSIEDIEVRSQARGSPYGKSKMADTDARQASTGRPRASHRPAGMRRPHRKPLGLPVVGIGASAGGLEACRKLLDTLPGGNGIAFILVQHLDPTHESMMVDLLTGHTSMRVQQAADGLQIEADHLYVIPPGTYLSIADGVLHLSQPQARHGARLPFDFLLHSLAVECGARAICIILSGTGADGSLGLKASEGERRPSSSRKIPVEAGFDGMPRSAIGTGAVDLVLSVAEIPAALIKYARSIAFTRAQDTTQLQDMPHDWLAKIIDLLRTKTVHDFRLYKPGTLQRRIERRMAMAGIESDGMARYLEILRLDTHELELLAKDLLINVTSFFRDPTVFDFLAEKIIPELVRRRTPDRTLRVLDCRMQYGRGDLFSRDALPGGNRRRAKQHQASGLCLRYRRRRGSQCARRALPAGRSRQTYPLSGWLASFRKKKRAIACCRNCAVRLSSPYKMCLPIRHSHAST